MKAFRIHMNDKVMVIAGKDAGKIGKVTRIIRKKGAVIVENANMVKRHVRPNPYANVPGDIKTKPMPIDVSNVMLVCTACGKPTRVGYKFVDKADGSREKVRFCKRCNEVIENSHTSEKK